MVSALLVLSSARGESQTVTFFGGNVKKVKAKTQTAATTRGEGSFSALSGASVTFKVPAGTTDTFLVTFSAECQLTGGDQPGADWVFVEARLDGTPMNPAINPDFGPGFCGGNDGAFNSSSGTWAVDDVPSGAHTVKIFWTLVDTGDASTLVGRLDDWSLVLRVLE